MENFSLEFSEKFDFSEYEKKAFDAFEKILNKSGEGFEKLGWVTYPEVYDREEYARMKEISEKVKKSDVLVVIGIGGSFLGAKAVIEALSSYYNKSFPKVIFVGNNLSGEYLKDVIDYIQYKDYYINVISKSGSTFETAIAFRVIKQLCEDKYKEESKDRIFITTDENESILKDLSIKNGYEMFRLPTDVGGRYSVLTPVGIFPIMCAGIDTDFLLMGANDAMELYSKKDSENMAVRYATIRNYLFNKGKELELLVVHEPKLSFFQEWWKQLFSESEGKDAKGLYTLSAIFTRDLHSFGQMIQDGNKILFETIIEIENFKNDIIIPNSNDDYDNLNYLTGKSLNEINKVAVKATRKAHTDGNVPTIKLSIPKLDTYNIGKLIYFFEMSCAISAYMLGVNPFNQPGVENYKKNMYKLLEEL